MAARQHYSVSNAGPVNNTSNSTWANVVTLPDFEPDASSTYALFWSSALQNATTTATDAQLRVRFGPSGFETTIATLNLESANIAEYPQLAGMFFHVEGVTPIDVYAEVSIKAETSANSINAKNGQIVALKLGANDVAAESLTRQTTTSTTPADAVTANFTSDGGDYVIIGYGEFDCPTTTVPVYIRLRCEGTNTGELGARINDATNLTPGMMVWRFTSVPSGARSAGFQYRAHTSATAGITNARILVMRAADFDAVYGAQLTSDSTGTSSDAVAITFTETLTANPHLLLGGWGTSGTTTSTNITTQLTEAGSDIAESIRRTYNAAAVRFHNSAFASVRTPGSGSKTYTLDRVQAGSTSITVGAGSGLALIDLGSIGGGPATYNESLTESGTAAQTATTSATFPNAQSEAATSAASQGVGLTMPVSRAEALTCASSEAAALTHRPSLSETAASGETSATSAIFASAATETVASADAGGTAATWQTARSENFAANDNASASQTMPTVRAEGVTAGDDATGSVVGGAVTYDDVLSEAVTANESAAAASTLGAALSETLTGAAAQAASAILLSVRSEAIAAAEIAQGAAQIGSVLSETTSSTVNQIVGAIFAGSLDEIVAANDDEAVSAEFSNALSETASAADQYEGEGGGQIDPAEVPANRHATTRPGLTSATTTTTNRSAASDPDLRTATTSKGRRAA